MRKDAPCVSGVSFQVSPGRSEIVAAPLSSCFSPEITLAERTVFSWGVDLVRLVWGYGGERSGDRVRCEGGERQRLCLVDAEGEVG